MAKPTSSARRPAGLQSLRNGARVVSSVKPRIIYTNSPKVYKIKPEEFLDLVQRLTGRSDDPSFEANSVTTPGLMSEEAQDVNVDMVNSHLHSGASEVTVADLTPASTQMLESLPSPRFVTINFLPLLAASPRAFNQSRRDVGFSFPSAAF